MYPYPSGAVSTGDNVRVWGVSMLSDPTEVNYYRRGGHPSDLTTIVKDNRGGSNGSSSSVKRPVLVAAIGLRQMPSTATAATAACKSSSSKSLTPQALSTNQEQGYLPFLIVYDVRLDTLVTAKSSRAQSSSNQDSGGGNDKSESQRSTSSDPATLTDPSKLNKKFGGGTQKRRSGGFYAPKVKIRDGIAYSGVCPPNEKAQAPNCIQCIPIFSKFDKLGLCVKIRSILPSTCGRFLIVCLSRSKDEILSNSKIDKTLTRENEDQVSSHVKLMKPDGATSESHSLDDVQASESLNTDFLDTKSSTSGVKDEAGRTGDMILVYSICSTEGQCVTLNEDPHVLLHIRDHSKVPTEVIALPSNAYENECTGDRCRCQCACVTADGSLRVFSVDTLDYTYHLPPTVSAPPYHTLTYCHVLGLERVCVARRDGAIVLVNITRPGDSDSSDEADTLQASLRNTTNLPTVVTEAYNAANKKCNKAAHGTNTSESC